MNNQSIIMKSIKHIEAHLQDELIIRDIADHFDFSSFYYSHLFKGITNLSPKDYIIGRKVTESLHDLLTSDARILDIAIKYGFNSNETYTRAFQKSFGLTPQWQHLMDNLKYIPHIHQPNRYYQLQFWFPDQADDSIYFFVGIEVDSLEGLPIQLTGKVIPPRKYLRFKHKGPSNQVGLTYDYIYKDFLPHSNYELKEFYDFEYYGPDYLGPYNDNSISEIYIPVQS